MKPLKFIADEAKVFLKYDLIQEGPADPSLYSLVIERAKSANYQVGEYFRTILQPKSQSFLLPEATISTPERSLGFLPPLNLQLNVPNGEIFG